MALSFTSLEFIVFLGLCVGSVRVSGSMTVRKWLLIGFSYLFYLSFGLGGVVVVTLTALVDYVVGRRLVASANSRSRLVWLWGGVVANLAPLVFLKYSGFLREIIAAALRPIGVHIASSGDILFPIIGLSYFTFSGISYVVDVYNETIEPSASVSEYLCYLIYFPKLVAGPIVRAIDFLPQLRSGLQVTAEDFETGCAYLLVGAVKKLVIADQLASHVGMIMAAPQAYDGFTLLQGIVGYTVQIYADFSGYSDMAIGCARLMGIRLPQNFLMPYSAVNIAEFWRRWHVTMSTWFRDYVFIPLELKSRGAQNAVLRASRNITITMLLCGLWHGPSWNFVVWGGLHGAALAIYQAYSIMRPRKSITRTTRMLRPGPLLSRLLTLIVVMVGWIFFGTQNLSTAYTYLTRLMTWSSDGVGLGSPFILPLAAVMVLVHLLIDKDRNVIEELASYSAPARILAYTMLLIALTCLVPADTVPFAYVRF